MSEFSEITSLKRLEKREEAQALLERISRCVLPIMQKRRLHVGKLSEFYPRNPNLLGININHGMRISLRLRYASDKSRFLPFNDIIGTMLHELCHNNYGPHNQAFFDYLADMTADMENILNRGLLGGPLHNPGRRLGTGTPLQKKLAASKYGMSRSRWRLGGKGYRLGGATGCGELRVNALRAAELRKEAELFCRHPDVPQGIEVHTYEFDDDKDDQLQCAKNSRIEVIDLTGDI